MNPQEIRDFAHRDWSAVGTSKRAHWTGVFQRDGWRIVWDAAQALLVHARSVQPGFPGDRARNADLAHHQSLRAQLDRAAHAFSRR